MIQLEWALRLHQNKRTATVKASQKEQNLP